MSGGGFVCRELEFLRGSENIKKEELEKIVRKIRGDGSVLDLELCIAGDNTRILYNVSIVDTLNKSNRLILDELKMGVLLVPQGREHEYLFAHPDGQRSLAENAGFARLIFVKASRNSDAIYPSDISILQKELSPSMNFLRPAVFISRQNVCDVQIPFLSVSEEFGSRRIVFKNEELIVEDVKSSESDPWIRRLIFCSSLNLIQSEAELLPGTDNINYGTVPCDYQKCVLAAIIHHIFSSSMSEREVRILLFGLGGGIIPNFVREFLPMCSIDTVDISPSIVFIAKKYFSFREIEEKCSIFLENGVRFFDEHSDKSEDYYDLIVIDVDTKDASQPISCPSPVFLEPTYLSRVRKALRMDRSFSLIINLVCRNSELRDRTCREIQNNFTYDAEFDTWHELRIHAASDDSKSGDVNLVLVWHHKSTSEKSTTSLQNNKEETSHWTDILNNVDKINETLVSEINSVINNDFVLKAKTPNSSVSKKEKSKARKRRSHKKK